MLLQNAAPAPMELQNAVVGHTVCMTCVLLCGSVQIGKLYSKKTVRAFLLDVGNYQTTRRHTQKKAGISLLSLTVQSLFILRLCTNKITQIYFIKTTH